MFEYLSSLGYLYHVALTRGISEDPDEILQLITKITSAICACDESVCISSREWGLCQRAREAFLLKCFT